MDLARFNLHNVQLLPTQHHLPPVTCVGSVCMRDVVHRLSKAFYLYSVVSEQSVFEVRLYCKREAACRLVEAVISISL